MKLIYLFLSDDHILRTCRALLIGWATATWCQIMSMWWPTRIRTLPFVWDVAETFHADRRRRFISGRFFLGVCILTPGAAAEASCQSPDLSDSLHWKQRACSFSASCDITLPLAKCSQTPERIICSQKNPLNPPLSTERQITVRCMNPLTSKMSSAPTKAARRLHFDPFHHDES